jgi:DinB superfamily
MADDDPLEIPIALLPPLAASDHVCLACSMAYADVTPADALAIVRTLPGQYRAIVVALPEEALRRRPDPTTWSVIEYVCHVRDVHVAFADRIRLALVADHPAFEPLGNDQRAERFRYHEANVAMTLDELELGADRFVELVATLGPDDWQRTARRLPGEDRDVLWMVRQTAHEGVHHLGDIEKVVSRLSANDSPPSDRPG